MAKILIDPGHDTPYCNQSPVVSDYYEGRQMWILSGYLIQELEAMGHECTCTRQHINHEVGVTARGRMAAGHHLAVSEHSNAGGNGQADRPEGIYFVDDDCGEIDALSKELASRLSGVCRTVIGTKQAARIYDRRSARDRDGNGKWDDDYYGFLFGAHEAKVPAIILENGFHDHKASAEWLLKENNLRLLAHEQAVEIDRFCREHFNEEDNEMAIPIMRPGDTGPSVVFLQATLYGYGYYNSSMNGVYDTATTEAVTRFQEANGLDPDGKCGPITGAKLLSGDVVMQERPECLAPPIEAKEEPMIYKTIDEVPAYAKATVSKLVQRNSLEGIAPDNLGLTDDLIRMLVINDREGLYGKDE